MLPSESNDCLGSNIFYCMTALLIGELFCRLCNILNEYCNYKRSYDPGNRLLNILKITFYVDVRCKLMLGLWILYLIWFLLKGTFQKDFSNEITIFIILMPFLKFLHFDNSLLDKAKWIRAGTGLDYGSGMASNYFHGYIKLNVPDKGDDKKGIVRRCDDYEDTHHIKFATKKLVVLIPHSLHTKPEIKSDLLTRVHPLETLERNRAGVHRPYKNDVYRLSTPINGQFYYIVLEGATPLQSFYESCMHGVTTTHEMVFMVREILFQFYRSIRKYTDCPETKDLVDFIYYNDYDANGDFIDVGIIVKDYVLKTLDSKKNN